VYRTHILYRAFSRDKDIYPNPEEFLPERHLTRSTTSGDFPLDPRKYVFGIGKRECPGNDFALASLFVTIATILATTSVRKAKDENGMEITPEIAYDGQSVTGRYVSVFMFSDQTSSPHLTSCRVYLLRIIGRQNRSSAISNLALRSLVVSLTNI
jgi:hypothetical protein